MSKVRSSCDKKDIGYILENYRDTIENKGNEKASKYLKGKEQDILNFQSSPLRQSLLPSNYSPDYICVITCEDEERKKIIKEFADNVLKNIPEWNKIDYSLQLCKKDPSSSIKKRQTPHIIYLTSIIYQQAQRLKRFY